jgi:hypothetical protein
MSIQYLPLFHHFKAIYQFPRHIFFLVKIVANASLSQGFVIVEFLKFYYTNPWLFYVDTRVWKFELFAETLTEVGAISLTEVYCSVLGIEAGTIIPTSVFIILEHQCNKIINENNLKIILKSVKIIVR